MILVPLLVGAALLTVAVTARRDLIRKASPPMVTLTIGGDAAGGEHALAEAFPHLRLWIPTDDYIRPPGGPNNRGNAGPDIVIRPAAAKRSRMTHLTDAA